MLRNSYLVLCLIAAYHEGPLEASGRRVGSKRRAVSKVRASLKGAADPSHALATALLATNFVRPAWPQTMGRGHIRAQSMPNTHVALSIDVVSDGHGKQSDLPREAASRRKIAEKMASLQGAKNLLRHDISAPKQSGVVTSQLVGHRERTQGATSIIEGLPYPGMRPPDGSQSVGYGVFAKSAVSIIIVVLVVLVAMRKYFWRGHRRSEANESVSASMLRSQMPLNPGGASFRIEAPDARQRPDVRRFVRSGGASWLAAKGTRHANTMVMQIRTKEELEGARRKLPFDVAHALARLGYHESWCAALDRAKQSKEGKESVFETLDEAVAFHGDSLKEARETWSSLRSKWAEGEHCDQNVDEVIQEVLVMARAAAEHCAAVQFSAGDEQHSEKWQAEADEFYHKFQAANERLKEFNHVLTKPLRDNIKELLWSTSWLAANSLKNRLCGNDDKEGGDGKGGDDYDYDEDANEKSQGDARYGDDYPGSSDDAIEDFKNMLKCLRQSFWESERWQGVRLEYESLETEKVLAELEAIAAVPGLPDEFSGGKGLNCIRLVLGDRSAEKDPLGDLARAALLKAEALELDVVLEVQSQSGTTHEEWLRSLAAAAAPCSRCRGFALASIPSNFAEIARLVNNIRKGGLTQERCTIILPLPGGLCVTPEDEWTSSYKTFHECLSTNTLPELLQDGNTLLEIPPTWMPEADGSPNNLTTLLDATSNLCGNFDQIGIVTSLIPALPLEARLSSADVGHFWYREYTQRLLAVARDVEQGFFFDSWGVPEHDAAGNVGLKASLEKGWIDFAADVQVMQPVGGAHTKTLIYLHGFTCDGYSYLKEPQHFYRKKECNDDDQVGTRITLSQMVVERPTEQEVQEDDGDGKSEYESYPGLKVILPSAPLRKITCYQGRKDLSWYDYLTDHEGIQEDDFPSAHLEEQTRRIHKLIDHEVSLVGARNVMVGGASQGCGVAMHIALTYPGDLGVLVGTMGQLLSCTPVTPEWIAREVPVYNYIGDSDSTFPIQGWTGDTWKRLENAGAKVYTRIEPGVDHAEHEDKWLHSFLTDVMPSKEEARKPKKKNKKNKKR